MEYEEDTSRIRRLGIFVCQDDQGMVEDYVLRLLDDIKDNLSDLIVIFQGEQLLPESRRELSEYTEHVVMRTNQGFDVNGWKFAMTEYWDWKRMSEYDEIVLFNNRFFGPFLPFSEIFAEMGDREADFWGLACLEESEDLFRNCPYGTWPKHIQRSFVVIRREMHTSCEFKEFWEKCPVYESMEDVLGTYESAFTKYFEDKGFTVGSYANIQGCAFEMGKGDSRSAELLQDMWTKGYPIMPMDAIETFLKEAPYENTGDSLQECLNVIEKNKSYDTKLIWKHILRMHPLSEIFRSQGMQYVLEEGRECALETGLADKAVVLVRIQDVASLEWLKDVLLSTQGIRVIVLSENCNEELLRNALESKEGIDIACGEGYGREVLRFWMERKDMVGDYEYLCIFSDDVDDKKTCWMNLVGNRNRILSFFREHTAMGVAEPACCLNREDAIGEQWKIGLDDVMHLVEAWHLGIPLEREKPLLVDNRACWIRACCLEKIRNEWTEELAFRKESARIERYLLSFVAQSVGYYTARIMTARQATVLGKKMPYLLEKLESISDRIRQRLRSTTNIRDFLDVLSLVEEDYIVLVSVRDTPGGCMPKEILECIHSFGFSDFRTGLWNMYVGVKIRGTVVCDAAGTAPEEPVEFRYRDVQGNFYVSSRAWRRGNQAEILINGIDYSTNLRGINIVLYDGRSGRVVDSIGFDSHEKKTEFKRKA